MAVIIVGQPPCSPSLDRSNSGARFRYSNPNSTVDRVLGGRVSKLLAGSWRSDEVVSKGSMSS